MSTRRGSRDKRCKRCLVHEDNCYCSEISQLDLKSKVSIILFKKERFLPSNTAQLTLNSLHNQEAYIRGLQDHKMEESFIDRENYQPLYLYPTDDSELLTPEYLLKFDKPVNLIVPDGTWRQAKKIHNREPLLNDIPHVKLNINSPSIYPLRRQKFEFGLCTHEAIAHALGIIEGEKTKDILIENLRAMIAAHLKNRPIFEKEKGPYSRPFPSKKIFE